MMATASGMSHVAGVTMPVQRLLFTQVARIMALNHLERVTKESVEMARESLVIGTTQARKGAE